MERIPNYKFSERIGKALEIIPERMHKFLHCDFLCGCDVKYVGFANYGMDIGDGRSFRDTAHVAYPWCQRLSNDQKKTTIILPVLESPLIIIHELGHVLDEALGFEHIALPITEYAKINREEAFAEAFTGYLFWYGNHIDPATEYLFDNLF